MLKLIFKIFLLLTIGFLGYFITNAGNFEKTQAYQILKDSGAIEYGKIILTEGNKTYNMAYVWAKKNVPVYYNETYTHLQHYIKLSHDLSLILKGSIISLIHHFSVYMNKNYPTLQDDVAIILTDGLIFAKKTLEMISLHLQNYTSLTIKHTNNMFKSFYSYFM